MTINYSSAIVNTLFGSHLWTFEISSTDYNYIITNPNMLNVNYNGTLININNDIYPNATQPPYGNLWNAYEGTSPSGHWYLTFLYTPSSNYFFFINNC